MRVYRHSGNVQQQDFGKCIFRQSKDAVIAQITCVFHESHEYRTGQSSQSSQTSPDVLAQSALISPSPAQTLIMAYWES